jgi:hypothetical protein
MEGTEIYSGLVAEKNPVKRLTKRTMQERYGALTRDYGL